MLSCAVLLPSILVVEPVRRAQSSCRSSVPFSATLVRLYTGIHGLDGSPADATGTLLVSNGLVRFVRGISEADPIQIASPGVEVGREKSGTVERVVNGSGSRHHSAVMYAGRNGLRRMPSNEHVPRDEELMRRV